MRYFLTLIFIFLSNITFANSVVYLGKSADGKAVFSITTTVNGDSVGVGDVGLVIGSEREVYRDLDHGTHIVESDLTVSDGISVSLLGGNEANSTVVATTTISNSSDTFSIHAASSGSGSAVTVETTLLLDAIKDNYDSNSTNTTAISNNTTAIANNATAIASNTKKISENATGVAEAMAIGVMQFDLSYDGLQTSIGGASFNGAHGFAFMAGKKIQDNVFTSFSATSTGNYAGGVSIKW